MHPDDPTAQATEDIELFLIQAGALKSPMPEKVTTGKGMLDKVAMVFNGRGAEISCSVLTKYLIRRVEWKNIRLRWKTCVVVTLIVCMVINNVNIVCV